MASSCPQCKGRREIWDAACPKCGFDFAAADREAEAKALAEAEAAAGCPACGAKRNFGQAACAQCGVDFARWKETQQKKRDQKKAEEEAAMHAAGQAATTDYKRGARERSAYLKLVLGTVIVFNPIIAIVAVVGLPTSDSVGLDLFIILGSIFAATCAVGVFFWKRWACYGFLSVSLLNTVFNLIFAQNIFRLGTAVVPFFLLAQGIFSDWELYE